MLTSALSWRWVLFVNIPIAVATVVATLAWLPESSDRAGRGAAAGRWSEAEHEIEPAVGFSGPAR